MKRSASSQSGRPKRVAMPNTLGDAMGSLNLMNTINTINTCPRPQLTFDMTPSSSHAGGVPMSHSVTNALFTGGSVPFGGVAMAHEMSQMSHASFQVSGRGSPSSPQMCVRPQPYMAANHASPFSEDEPNLLHPAEYLLKQNVDFLDVPLDTTGMAYYPALTMDTSTSLDQSTSVSVDLLSGISIDAPDMAHIHSQNSFGDSPPELSMDPSQESREALVDDCIRGTGSLHMAFPPLWNNNPFDGFPMHHTMPVDSLGQDVVYDDADEVYSALPMERNSSMSRSQRQRMRETAVRHLSNAGKNAILPKNIPYSMHPAHQAAAGSTPNSVSDKHLMPCSGKMEITKARRERPPHKRLFCENCPKDAKGFRGPHELQRHISRHHERQCKRYICVDPRLDGIASSLTVFKSLDSCKKCHEKKQYGADYNAAAHLRRTHFKERAPRTKGRPQPAHDDNNSFPPMEDLKDWIKEVTMPHEDAHTDKCSVLDNAHSTDFTLLFPDQFDEQDQKAQFYLADSDLALQLSPDPGDDADKSSVPRFYSDDTLFHFDEQLATGEYSHDPLYAQMQSDDIEMLSY